MGSMKTEFSTQLYSCHGQKCSTSLGATGIKGSSSSPRSAQFCLHCTLVWLFYRKTYLLFSPDHLLALASRPTVQTMPGLHRIMDTRQVREYPDSTISIVLTVFKMADHHDVK